MKTKTKLQLAYAANWAGGILSIAAVYRMPVGGAIATVVLIICTVSIIQTIAERDIT